MGCVQSRHGMDRWDLQLEQKQQPMVNDLHVGYKDTKRHSFLPGFQSNKSLCEDALPPPPPLPSSVGGSLASPPPPPTAAVTEPDTIESVARTVLSYPNPGPYEQAMMSAGKNIISLDTFDGFRCDISKQLSPFMAVFHSFWMGTSMLPDGRKSMFTFMAQVADESGLLMTRVDPGRGSIDGRIHRSLLGGLCLGKVQIGVGTENGPSDQILTEVDFGANTWTGNLKYGSMGGGIVYGLNYFQAITPKLSMGGEGMYIAANNSLLSSYMLRYQFSGITDVDDDATTGNSSNRSLNNSLEVPGASIICANYNTGQAMFSLNYKRCVTPGRVVLAGELQCNPYSLESQVLMGAEFKLQRSKLCFCVDGAGRIQSLVEAKMGMAPGSPTLNFSADMNHFTDEMRFGYGINIEG